MHLTVPGFYSPGQALTRAGIGYLEQFAAYDPPAGGGPRAGRRRLLRHHVGVLG